MATEEKLIAGGIPVFGKGKRNTGPDKGWGKHYKKTQTFDLGGGKGGLNPANKGQHQNIQKPGQGQQVADKEKPKPKKP